MSIQLREFIGQHARTPVLLVQGPPGGSGSSTPALLALEASVPLAGHGSRFCAETNWASAASRVAMRVAVSERFWAALMPRVIAAAMAITTAKISITTTTSMSVKPAVRASREFGAISGPMIPVSYRETKCSPCATLRRGPSG